MLLERLRAAYQLPLPVFATLEVRAGDLTDLVPASYRADAVIVLEDQRPVLVLIVEVQRSEDADKRSSWPCYAVLARARNHCPVCVVVYGTRARCSPSLKMDIRYMLPD